MRASERQAALTTGCHIAALRIQSRLLGTALRLYWAGHLHDIVCTPPILQLASNSDKLVGIPALRFQRKKICPMVMCLGLQAAAKMAAWKLALCALTLATLCSAAAAKKQQLSLGIPLLSVLPAGCGSVYIVQPGDTCQSIA